MDNETCITYHNVCIVDGIVPIEDKYKFNPNTCILYQENKIVKLTEQEKQNRLKNKNKKRKKPTIEEAVSDYRNGCQEAFEYVYNHYKSKIKYMASVKAEKGHEEELFSDITMQLFQCMKKYKFGSVKFNTFFWRCAQNVVGVHFTPKTTQKRNNIYGFIPIDSKVNSAKNDGSILQDIIEDKSTDDLFNQIDFNCTLEEYILPCLSDNKDRMILKLLSHGYIVKDICKTIHMTPAGVYLRLKKIRENINNKITYKELQKLLKS